jgi:hypothetical protein
MNSSVAIDVFVEDRAHEAFLLPMVRRIAREANVDVSTRVRSARGGHGRAIAELGVYQNLVEKTAAQATEPTLLVVGIDGNCMTFAKAREAIQAEIKGRFIDRMVMACPDPHVERWYLADPDSFETVVGYRPTVGKKKCARDHYKRLLSKAVQQAGHPPTLGGIEFASELVDGMDLYRAGKNDHSLGAFVDDLHARFVAMQPTVVPR